MAVWQKGPGVGPVPSARKTLIVFNFLQELCHVIRDFVKSEPAFPTSVDKAKFMPVEAEHDCANQAKLTDMTFFLPHYHSEMKPSWTIFKSVTTL